MKVLVAGGLGAIGSFAVRYLVEDGNRPVVYDNRRDFGLIKDISDKVEFVEGSTLDWPRVMATVKDYKIERIIHCAALMPPACKANPLMAVEVNIHGFVNILEVARLSGVAKVVLASTIGVYAAMMGEHAAPTYKPINEDYFKDPFSLYDATRYFCERCGLQYLENYGLDFNALRFAHTYGPGKLTHGAMATAARIIDNAMRGEPTQIARGREHKSDYLYNRDSGRALALACYASNTRHRQFHIGSGKLSTLAEFVAVIHRFYPEAVIDIGPGTDLPGLDAGRSCFYDISRAREELGYEPRYNLETGIKDYIELVKKLESLAKN